MDTERAFSSGPDARSLTPRVTRPNPRPLAEQLRWNRTFFWFDESAVLRRLGLGGVLALVLVGEGLLACLGAGWVPVFLLTGFCSLGDTILVRSLSLLGLSFPEEPAQLVVLSLPRWLVVLFVQALSPLLLSNAFWINLILQLVGSAAYLEGLLREPGWVRPRKLEVFTAHVRRALRILHLSDLHLERLAARERQILAWIEQSPPDLILLSGDYLNTSYTREPTAQAELVCFLERLCARSTVVGTLGTPGVDDRASLPSLLERAGVVLLRDQGLTLRDEEAGTLCILGVECDHDPAKDAEGLERTLKNADREGFQILLFHSPELAPHIGALWPPIDLYLCGHTHGGQIRMPGWGALVTGSSTGKKFEKGLYQVGPTRLYVHPGVGLEGNASPRMRLFCSPEMVEWTLRPLSRINEPLS